MSENYLTELVRDIRSSDGLDAPGTLLTYPMNFADPVFKKVLQAEGPFDIVANFAAHKHVRSEKDMYSIEALLENNLFRAKGLLDVLCATPPRHFFCVSTDKAANPVNIMGASKKIMEDMIMAYRDRLPVTTARFANVAYSHGSLLDGFLHRLLRGQPLSAPRDVRRYFVSPAESGQICLLACTLGRSGEMFYPKLDRARDLRTFSDIAVELLHHLGLDPQECESEAEAKHRAATRTSTSSMYPVYFFDSDTSGEKDEEEFHTLSERVDEARFKALGVVERSATMSGAETLANLEALSDRVRNTALSKGQLVSLVKGLVPSFSHLETGKSLDQRM